MESFWNKVSIDEDQQCGSRKQLYQEIIFTQKKHFKFLFFAIFV